LTRESNPPVFEPTGAAPAGEVEEGAGRIELDFTDSSLKQVAFVERRNARGRRVDEPMKQPWDEENVLWIDLAPGTYLVWWHDGQGEHVGLHLRVEAGRLTRVPVTSDQVRVLPIEPGMARLVVTVRSADGKPRWNVEPEIDPVPWIADVLAFHATDANGHTQLDLLAGTYEVRVDELSQRVLLVDGQRTELVSDAK